MRGSRLLRVSIFLALVILLNMPVPASLRIKSVSRDIYMPFQNVMWQLIGRGRAGLSALGGIHKVMQRGQRLSAENANLNEELRKLRTMEQENRELRAHLGFKQRSSHKLVLCRVIGRGDASGWWQTIRLNKGRKHGLRPNMAAITTDGLVGRTRTVSHYTSEVLLITDPNCRVSCRFERTEAFGVARGSGVAMNGDMNMEMLCAVKPFRVDYIAKGHHIFKGDRVVTSGLGGLFPEGLLVGRVTRAGLDESGLYRRATVEPAADVGALKHVFVVVESESPAVSAELDVATGSAAPADNAEEAP